MGFRVRAAQVGQELRCGCTATAAAAAAASVATTATLAALRFGCE